MLEVDRVAAGESLSPAEIRQTVLESVSDEHPRRVLLIPPDFTRFHSGAGFITQVLYHHFADQGVSVDVLPALGTHSPLSAEQWKIMFGDIPPERAMVHDWKSGLTTLGGLSPEEVSALTEGTYEKPIAVQINSLVLEDGYDLVLSIGQVVPHEVVGMSNHAKNLFVGVGGQDMINHTHLISAVYGIERIMGQDHTPVRAVFDLAFERYLADRPIGFIQTVTTQSFSGDHPGAIRTHGVFCGRRRRSYEQAVALSQVKNMIHLEKPLSKCVVYLDPSEFHSTWLGNKAVYRTRMAIADGGELLILAPGVQTFGEAPEMDRLIRKYGYRGREKILAALECPENADLRANAGAAAHLIHGSSEGRFRITYAVRELSQAAVEAVGYAAAPFDTVCRRYDPTHLRPGWNTLPDGEEIYFISNPALGLWTLR